MKYLLTAITCLLCCHLVAVAQQLKVDFVTPSIVRVQWAAGGTLQNNGTGVCIYPQQAVKVKQRDRECYTEYASSALIVRVSKSTSAVTFIDRRERCSFKSKTHCRMRLNPWCRSA